MAVPKSRPCADRSAAGARPADEPLTELLAAFLAAQLRVRIDPPRAFRLCVALSGGRDSVVLLHALSRLCVGTPITLSALHVHHGISPHADDWARFCTEFCASCAVPLSIVRVEVPGGTGEGPEAAARRARHAVFANCAADLLALAHHRDDQAETVLLNLLRGAGIAGAAGMPGVRPQGRGAVLVRPLLEVPRTLIEQYANVRALDWIDDESNDDTHFRRNFLRHEVMPRLTAQFPGAPKSLARFAGHCAEGAQLLDELAAIDRAALASPAGRIELAGFNGLSPARARNLLRFAWLAAGFRAPDTRWIDEARRQLASADELSETCVTTVDGELHLYRGELHILGAGNRVAPAACQWSGQGELPWAGGWLRLVPVSAAGTGAVIDHHRLGEGPLWIRPRQGGERLRPAVNRPRRSLRKLCQEAAIPPWERERLPLLWIGEQLAWVGGLGVDAGFSCMPGEAGVMVVWESGEAR